MAGPHSNYNGRNRDLQTISPNYTDVKRSSPQSTAFHCPPHLLRTESCGQVDSYGHDIDASPLYWNLPSDQSGLPRHKPLKNTACLKFLSNLWCGWKVIILNSWLNVLLLLLPVSWILHLTMPKADGLIFIFCILSMMPLVKLHDLATCELASRIGGSKTGLLNASLSNTVELVIAVSALRKCELRVVQSSLIGSILNKLLLVLGMGLFAGGLRFSDQRFDLAATHIHSSLLSISVGAILLPAAYYFTLGSNTAITNKQNRALLQMSHGVSIVLLFIYISYMIFQLWSHTHLYKDDNESQLPPSLSSRNPPLWGFVSARGGKTYDNSGQSAQKVTSNVHLPQMPPFAAQLTPPDCLSYAASSSSFSEYSQKDSGHGNSVGTKSFFPCVNRVVHEFQCMCGFSDGRDSVFCENSCTTSLLGKTREDSSLMLKEFGIGTRRDKEKQNIVPQLSWVMTLFLLSTVTIMVALNADWMVESMNGSISTVISKQWIGLILLPAVSSTAECVTAINVSVKDQLPLSISAAVASAIQTVLFVIPVVVTLGWVLDKPLPLLFEPFESVVLYISVQTMTWVVSRGQSTWLEGVELICLYIIIAVAFWFYPVSEFAVSLAVCST